MFHLFMVLSVSRNGMEPSSLVSSVVKFMEGSTELMCCKNSFFCDCYSMTKPIGLLIKLALEQDVGVR